MSTFDLSDLKSKTQNDAWVTILHPGTGVSTGIRINVVGPDSDLYRKVDSRIKNANLLAAQRRGKITAEVLDAGGLDLLVGVTVGWEGVVFSGQPLEFTEENVRQVYTDFRFIREQVDEFVGQRANFFNI